jgi:serine/threonine protein kinase
MKQIGKYELDKLLGKGAVGEVWLARDTVQQMDVALKVLKNLEGIVRDRGLSGKDILLAEAKTQTRLGIKEHAVRIFNADFIDEEKESCFIAKEYVDGPNLREYVKNLERELTLDEIVDISIQVCKGLEEIHGEGILHNDLKPENILIGKDRIVKIDDFGSSPSESDRKAYGWILSSAPETFNNEYSIRSDLYSLGVLTYWLIEAGYPFTSSQEEWSGFSEKEIEQFREELRNKIRSCEPKPIKRDILKKLSDIVYKLLRKNPDERYQSATELKEDLINFRDRTRIYIVEKYQGIDPDDHEAMDDLIEEFLMSLDRHPPFDEGDIGEGKFPYGILKKDDFIQNTSPSNFCAGPLIKYLGLMYILTKKSSYLELAEQKTDEFRKHQTEILGDPVITSWIYSQAFYFLYKLTGNSQYKEEAESAATHLSKQHFADLGNGFGYIRNRARNSKETAIFSNNLFQVNQVLWKNPEAVDELIKYSDLILANCWKNGFVCERFEIDPETGKATDKDNNFLMRTLARMTYGLANINEVAGEYQDELKQFSGFLIEQLERFDYKTSYDLKSEIVRPDNYGRAWALLALAKLSLDKPYHRLASSILDSDDISSGKGILNGSVKIASDPYSVLFESDFAFIQALMLPVLKRRGQLEKYKWIYTI